MIAKFTKTKQTVCNPLLCVDLTNICYNGCQLFKTHLNITSKFLELRAFLTLDSRGQRHTRPIPMFTLRPSTKCAVAEVHEGPHSSQVCKQ